MSEPASQQEVVDYYRDADGVSQVGTVGEYVRVCKTTERKTCFGPVERAPTLNWKVVEIDWKELEFLLAPNNAY